MHVQEEGAFETLSPHTDHTHHCRTSDWLALQTGSEKKTVSKFKQHRQKNQRVRIKSRFVFQVTQASTRPSQVSLTMTFVLPMSRAFVFVEAQVEDFTQVQR